jgi:hypothetical protein
VPAGRCLELLVGVITLRSRANKKQADHGPAWDCSLLSGCEFRSAALSVLRSSMVTVMGPMPPGTGVMAPATLTAVS